MEHLTRQSDLIPAKVLDTKITIIGAGAVGSWTSLCLAKMGFSKQTVIDFDTIDVENMNCQMFPMENINDQKADTIHDLVKYFTHETIITRDEEYKEEALTGDIVISAVDSMKVRRAIFENCFSNFLIDPRMSAEAMLLYVVDMRDAKARDAYAKTLYTDGEALHERCTEKSTIYCANVLSGLVCKAVKNIACGDPYTKYISYDMKLNDFTNFTTQEKA